MTERFLAAVASGDVEALLAAMAPDVVLVADGGGQGRRRPGGRSSAPTRSPASWPRVARRAPTSPACGSRWRRSTGARDGRRGPARSRSWLDLSWCWPTAGSSRCWYVVNPDKLAGLGRVRPGGLLGSAGDHPSACPPARRARRAGAVRPGPSRRRRLRQRRDRRHLDGGRHRGHLLHRHRRRRRRLRRHPARPDGPAAPGRAAGRRRGGRRDRRPVPRLSRRPAGADPRPAPRHQPGHPAGAAAAGADHVARAVLGADRRQPSRPHGGRRVDAARGLPRRAQPVRLPRTARRRGPGRVDGVGGVAGRQPAGRPRRRRHRRRRPQVRGAAVATSPRSATTRTWRSS